MLSRYDHYLVGFNANGKILSDPAHVDTDTFNH